jgi:hypothetical protein
MKRRSWHVFSDTSTLKSSGAPRTSRSWRTAHQPEACTPSIETPSHDALTRMAMTGDVIEGVGEFNPQRTGYAGQSTDGDVVLSDLTPLWPPTLIS